MRWWTAIAIASGTLVGACIDLQAYTCGDDAECTSAGGGRCESTGYCSYPDAECESGQRYGGLAGGFAGQCTDAPAATGDTTGASDDAPVATDTLGAEVTSIGSSSDDDTSESTGPDPLPVCGNGVEERGEDCDDGDAEDGDGCNSDCVRGGTPVWEIVVAGEAGGSDRLFGLTKIAAGDLVAVGHMEVKSRDVLVMRFTPDGREVQRVVHDVEGGFDDAEAVTQGGLGPLYVCGRATVDGSTRPWASRWNAQLTGGPTHQDALPMTLGGTCHDVVYTTSTEVVAVGGTGAGGTVWSYTFSEDDIGGGEEAVASMPGESFLKEVVLGPGGNVYAAGRLGNRGVIYQPVAGALGDPLVETRELAEIQSMVIPGDGSTIFTGGLLHNVPGKEDQFWVSAYELDGAERWRSVASSDTAIDEVEDIAIDGAGNIYAIGHTVIDDPNRWVAKLDPEGVLVWDRSDYAGSEDDDRGRSIEVLPGGDLVVVAEITGEDLSLDGWIARLIP